jgi:hypothetical protein
VKDDWPSLDADDARRAVSLFADRYGGGDIKLFGGEPLLVPEVVRAAIEEASARPEIRRIYLSTNGLGLDQDWLDWVTANPRVILTLSMDGRPEDHRRLRRALPNVGDCYDHLLALMPRILRTPRVVITQTIAPATATRALDNFEHLSGLGLHRFNFLPGYFLPWRDEQLAALRAGFEAIGDRVVERWERGERLYVRNLFTWAPTPFFNTGVVVDSDRSIHASNLGLSGALDDLLPETRVGSLDEPPSLAALSQRAERVNGMLERALPERVWRSTLAVDAELTRFCQRLLAHYPDYRRARGLAA